MESRNSHSGLQKYFQTQSTFKRNTRYYNAPQIIQSENKDCALRRKPMGNPDQNTQKKLDSSFTNSTAALSQRLDQQITKFTRRVSGQFSPQKTNYQKQYSSPSSPKLKSFSIERMTSRQYLHDLKNKVVEDERQFNNFKIQKHDLSKTCDFSKLKGRSLDFKLNNINDLFHQSKKAYQFCFYNQATLKSNVNYKLQNKQKKRYFFIKKRQSDFAASILDPQKVDEGLKVASNFKGSNLRQDKIPSFYLTTGKDLPSQYDMRYMTNLTNYYKDQQEKVIQPKIDFTVKKLKQDLIQRRKQCIRMSKNSNLSRQQVCDLKYFKNKLHKSRNKRKLY